MDDLISRRDAIDAIVNTVSRVGMHDNSAVARYGATFRQHEIIDIIETLPSAQQWIPVTERLPESGQSVLIAENDTDPDWYAAIGQYKYGRWEWRDDMHTALPPKVIAWMPLPTPFREGGEAD